MDGIGKMIGQGNTAEIYDYNADCILKLYREAMPEQACIDEFRYTLIAYHATSNVPEPIDIIHVDGRIGAVYKKLPGRTMLKQMMARIWKSGYYAKCLAAYHIGIQQPIDAEIPTVKEKLQRDIESTDLLSEDEKLLIYQNLSDLPDGDILCHFDFHPDNIMLNKNQYGVLDWMTACKGDRLSDVSRTGIILKFSQIPRVPAFINVIAGAVQKGVYRKYIRCYLDKTSARIEDVEKWDLVVAAARLREWIPEKEKQELMTFIKTRLNAIPRTV